MAEYMDKEVFLSSMGLIGDETKYGNRDAEHQSRSYSTYISYEIMDSVEDSIVEEELEPVKHGRWLTWEEMFPEKTPKRKNNLGVFCDQCRNHADNMSDYCPNCGARMYEEAQQ